MIYFTKLEGIGNDFIAINNMENKLIYDYGKLSKYLCIFVIKACKNE